MSAISLLALKWLAGSPVPARWFYPAPPSYEQRSARTGRLRIEIVSHCWRYSRLLAYQLSSLIQYPVNEPDITMTVFHAREDRATCQLLDFVAQHEVSNVRWRWRCMEPQRLFRRAIGRNLAALETTADWIWFTDCDMTFQSGCLDGLHRALQGRRDALLYPRIESKTDVYSGSDLVIRNELDSPALLSVAEQSFVAHSVSRATGPLQITHGDVARAVGYCAAVKAYQQPATHWQKAVEDRCFRWLLDTAGSPIDVPGVCRIQHADKGRYRQGSRAAGWRQRVRRWQHAWRQRRQ